MYRSLTRTHYCDHTHTHNPLGPAPRKRTGKLLGVLGILRVRERQHRLRALAGAALHDVARAVVGGGGGGLLCALLLRLVEREAGVDGGGVGLDDRALGRVLVQRLRLGLLGLEQGGVLLLGAGADHVGGVAEILETCRV